MAACLGEFFTGGKGPSHHQLDQLLTRDGLSAFDPAPADPREAGKMKRVRQAFGVGFEKRPRETLICATRLVGLLRAAGSFSPGRDGYAGEAAIEAARSAFLPLGWSLEANGSLYRTSLEALDGRELTQALRAYVRRIQQATDDAALTVGSAKDLLEAAARHATTVASGTYDKRMDFATTVFRACTQLGVAVPTGAMLTEVDRDPYRGLEQALVLAAIQVSRLRNAEGSGHGRPEAAKLERRQGAIAAQSAAVACLLLLSEADGGS